MARNLFLLSAACLAAGISVGCINTIGSRSKTPSNPPTVVWEYHQEPVCTATTDIHDIETLVQASLDRLGPQRWELVDTVQSSPDETQSCILLILKRPAE